MQSIKAFLKGESIKYTKGEQIWVYIYSKDVAKAMYLLAENGRDKEIYCIVSCESKKIMLQKIKVNKLLKIFVKIIKM